MRHSDGERLLIPGENFPQWPIVKLLHAHRLGSELSEFIQGYRSRLGTETTCKIYADGLSGVVRARIVEEPNLEEWSLRFGDVIHNYRAALDALTWALAHLDGGQPHQRHRRRIYFPMAKSVTEWRKLAASTLASIPHFALERLERVQPYQSLPVEDSVAITLNELDVQDKHKSAVEFDLVAADKTHYMTLVRFRSPHGDSAASLHEWSDWEWVAPESGLADGDEIIRFRSRTPIDEFIIEKLPLTLRVRHGEKLIDLFSLMNTIDAQVAATFDIALYGEPTADTLAAIRRRGLSLGEPANRP